MSQSAEIIDGLSRKNSSTPLILLKNSLMKLVPRTRVEKIKDEIMRVACKGDLNILENVIKDIDAVKQDITKTVPSGTSTMIDAIDKIKDRLVGIMKSKNLVHLETLLNLVFFDPRVAILGGIGYEFSSVMNIKTLDSRFDSLVARKIQEHQRTNLNENKEILFYIHGLLQQRGRSIDDDEGKITSMDIVRERISFSVDSTQNGIRDRVFATIMVPSFRIRYESSDRSDRFKSGVWQFPECLIGVQVIATRTSATYFNLSFDSTPHVLHPRDYLHPYVYSSNNSFCTGSLHDTLEESKMLKMDFIDGIYYYLKRVVNIFTTGYSEKSYPAFGLLNRPEFNKYKIYNSIDLEREAQLRQSQKLIMDEFDAIKKKQHRR